MMKLNELVLENDYFDFDEKFYQLLDAQPLNNPHLISYSKPACDLIGLDYEECESEDFIKFMNGEKVLEGSVPYSTVYAGHQFGYFVPQLGDGRAINLGKINGWHLQTKGSGLTRYSRQGDGRAVLRSSIREYIISEAMHHLGIPTTRALAIIGSSHKIHRTFQETEMGAIVMRLSPSWVRIGSFEFFAREKESKKHLQQLADYVIEQSYPHLKGDDNAYEKMYFELVDRTTKLLAQWQAYGFMHGVMNTDNMSMDGLTIDYGPFAFMDYYDKHCVCNHSDYEGRYSYNNQPHIAKWNLEVLAHALGKICDVKNLMDYLERFYDQYEKLYCEIMCERLGLDVSKNNSNYVELIIELLGALQSATIDYNVFFYELTRLDNLDDISSILDICVYRQNMQEWFESYKEVVDKENRSFKERQVQMKKANPKYVIKNYMLQEAIEKAKEGDFSLVNDLLKIAQSPFDEHKDFERYAKPSPMEFANVQLSCSS